MKSQVHPLIYYGRQYFVRDAHTFLAVLKTLQYVVGVIWRNNEDLFLPQKYVITHQQKMSHFDENE